MEKGARIPGSSVRAPVPPSWQRGGPVLLGDDRDRHATGSVLHDLVVAGVLGVANERALGGTTHLDDYAARLVARRIASQTFPAVRGMSRWRMP